MSIAANKPHAKLRQILVAVVAIPQSALDDLLDCNHALQQELFAVAEREGLGNLFAHRPYAARCEIASQLRKEWQSSIDRRRAWALLHAK